MFFRLFGALSAPLFLFSSTVQAAAHPYYYSGQNVEICHPPDSITHKTEIPGKPYFLNYVSGDNTQTYLTIVIWESDIPSLEIEPVRYFSSDDMCMAGEVTEFRGQKQLVIKSPSQLVVNKK